MQKKKIDLHYHKACKNHAEVFMIFPHFNEIFNVPYSTYCKAIFLFFVSIHIYFSIEIWWKWKILLCVIISHAKIMLKLHDFAFFSFHLNPLQITIFKFLVSNYIYYSLELWGKWPNIICIIISHAKFMRKFPDFPVFI